MEDTRMVMNTMIPNNQMGSVDMEVIKTLLKIHKPVFVVEVGCWLGQVSVEIMKAGAERLLVIDTFGGEGSHLKGWIEENRFDVLGTFKKNMEEWSEKIDICIGTVDDAIWKIGEVDLVWIDGDHRYSRVSKDIELLWKKIKEDGVMVGHDWDGAEWEDEYIEEDYINGRHHGVTKAVSEFFKDKGKVRVSGRVWWITK